MKTETASKADLAEAKLRDADLVMLFGQRFAMEEGDWLGEVRETYPEAVVVGCSTGGEIFGEVVRDDPYVLTAVKLEKSKVRAASINIDECPSVRHCGIKLAEELMAPDLVHVLVFSEGNRVNGSELADGLVSTLPPHVVATGGLSADDERFEKTLVVHDARVEEGLIVAVGFYGADLKVGYGTIGGWDAFGPYRKVTKSKDNVLFELDGEPALALYKRYLGEYASGLPATGLRFPLAVQKSPDSNKLTRTVVAVDEDAQSVTFAGDVPEGSTAQLMKANFDRLVDGAAAAAEKGNEGLGMVEPELAVLVSCVGRRWVLEQRTEEELESVRDILGDDVTLTGFYSYGELCPSIQGAPCELQNQTMTVTTFREC